MDNLKGYKTVLFNVLMTVFMVLKLWNPELEAPDPADLSGGLDMMEGAIVFVWGIGNQIIRAITNSPIFTK